MVLKVDATLHRLRPCLGFELNMICHTLRPCESGPYTRQMKRGIFNNDSIGKSRIRIRLVVVFIPHLKKEEEARPKQVVDLRQLMIPTSKVQQRTADNQMIINAKKTAVMLVKMIQTMKGASMISWLMAGNSSFESG